MEMETQKPDQNRENERHALLVPLPAKQAGSKPQHASEEEHVHTRGLGNYNHRGQECDGRYESKVELRRQKSPTQEKRHQAGQ